jgi:hypothetical protein
MSKESDFFELLAEEEGPGFLRAETKNWLKFRKVRVRPRRQSTGGESVPEDFTPVLFNPTAGTPTDEGTVGATVDTNRSGGILYYVVVTNGGSCTAAQLKAGSGGNIVAGSGASQSVEAIGTQVLGTIVGLAEGTTYQIKMLHNRLGLDSAQASASFVTEGASPYLPSLDFSDERNSQYVFIL